MSKKKRDDRLQNGAPVPKVVQTPGLKNAKVSLIVLSLFALITILVYANSLYSPFIWDDQYLIAENHFIKSFRYIPEIFKHHLYYSSAGVSNFYRPLQNLFLMVDYRLWKANPIGYHITNIIFHISCGFLIYLFINTLFKRRGVAFLVGLLFLVHPANSTVVNYIASRADSQATLFILLSLYLFVRYLRDAGQGFRYLIASIASFVFALLSKEIAVILPFLLLLTMPFVTDRKRGTIKDSIPFFVILAIYGLLRLTVLNFASPSTVDAPSLYIRLLTAPEAFVRLAGLLFFPSHIHIEKSIPYSSGLFQLTTIVSLVILAAMIGSIFWVKRYSRMALFGLSWFFLALLPMSNIVPINATMADHWLYLSSLGFFLCVVGGSADLIERSSPDIKRFFKGLSLFLIAGALLTFSYLTVQQNNIWRDPLRFYQLALEHSPNSYRAHNEIGIIYLGQDRLDMAISEFKQAVALNPMFDQAYDNMGVAYDKKGDFDNAISQYKRALEINPNNPKIYNNLGNAYNKTNRLNDAEETYKKALRLAPDFKSVYNNLGVVYYKKRDYDAARRYWNKMLELEPGNADVMGNLKILEDLISRDR